MFIFFSVIDLKNEVNFLILILYIFCFFFKYFFQVNIWVCPIHLFVDFYRPDMNLEKNLFISHYRLIDLSKHGFCGPSLKRAGLICILSNTLCYIS